MSSFLLPLPELLSCVVCGVVLNIVYLTLLWLTIKFLPHTQHKGLCLFGSVILRLALFLGLAIWFSQQSPARFLWIVIGFVITRLVVVGLIKTKEAK